jgi:predicted protein tyrosine phosphatase
MKFYVYSRQRAAMESERISEPTLIISITDPERDLNTFAENEHIRAICRVQFDDVTRANARECDVLMTPRHAELIKQYLKRYIDEVESVIVHCEGGISRSAGIMAAIQKYLLGDDSAIRKDGRYLPNGHCYELMLNALESY